MLKRTSVLALAGVVLLAGCAASMPSGPNVMVLPGTGKNFDQFRLDDMDCRGFAQSGLNGATTESVSTESGVRTAALGTVLGAGQGQGSSATLQRRYDTSYQQCMYAKGNKIPGSYSMMSAPAIARTPTTTTPPPPPPGMPPR
jgi:hypothetical protein